MLVGIAPRGIWRASRGGTCWHSYVMRKCFTMGKAAKGRGVSSGLLLGPRTSRRDTKDLTQAKNGLDIYGRRTALQA